MNVQRFGILVLATALVSCGGAGEATGTASYTVTVSPSSLAIALGVTQTANAIVTRQLGASALIDANAAVSWTSSDQTIATVTASGGTATITGVGHGTATITASSNSSSGSTTITVTAPNCLISSSNPALAVGTVTGALGPADCRDNRDNSKPADFYRLVVASDQMVQLDVASTAFTPDVRVFSPTNTLVDNGTGSPTRLLRALPPGTYTVAVSVGAGTAGAYSLTVASTAVTVCAFQTVAVQATVPSTITGSLVTTDCRLTGTNLPAAKFYKFTTTSTQTITSTLASTTFSPALDIYDSGGAFVSKGDSSAVGQVRSARSFSAGTYYIRVSGIGSNPLGAFTLTFASTGTSTTIPNCSTASFAASITPGTNATTITSALTTSDCKLPDGSYYAKLYRLTVTSTSNVQIDMLSTAFDAYLYLFDSNLGLLTTNDDVTATSTDSRITRVLAPGTYFVAANSLALGLVGNYSLIIKTVP